ncbi:hypothetical protein BVY02_00750 [bacterium J17]|nr:hypothetical protein BVY02_00750 [bacterium J17]
MLVKGYGATDVGCYRENNEDNYLVDTDLGLYMVCDGMGGAAAGEVASQTVVSAVHSFIKAQTLPPASDENAPKTLVNIVRGSVEHACSEVQKLIEGNEKLRGMGTTMTLLLVAGDKAVMGHIGDSRLYLKRRGEVHQISSDHTLASEMLRQGRIKPDSLEDNPYAHVLTKAIGPQPSVQADIVIFELVPDDICLLCSDGLSGSVNNPVELTKLLNKEASEELLKDLIELAKERDGDDNITAVLVEAQEDGANQIAERKRCNEVYLQTEVLKQVYLFQDLSLQELFQVHHLLWIADYQKGSAVVREGEQSDSLYIILEGRLNVKRGETEVATLTAGEHFGEVSLLSSSPRTATVETLEDSRLLILDKDAFVALTRENSVLGVKLLWRLAIEFGARLDRANALLEANC